MTDNLMITDEMRKQYAIYKKESWHTFEDYYRGFAVYMFVRKNGEILYVGKSKRLRKRLTEEHFTEKGHLPKECYNLTRRGKIIYHIFETEKEMSMAEIYFINKYMPKYNTDSKWEGNMWEIPALENLEWKTFDKDAGHQMSWAEWLKDEYMRKG